MSAFPVRKRDAEFEQFGRYGNVVVVGADALEALVESQGGSSAKAVVVDVQCTGEVERIHDLPRGVGRRRAVLEVQRSDRRLDAVGGAERLDRLFRHLGLRCRRQRHSQENAASHGDSTHMLFPLVSQTLNCRCGE